jgi:phage anti-repressor protein
MKKITILTFLFFNIFVYSQSKSETETWISEKINLYGFKDNQVSHYYDLTFEKGNVIVNVRSYVLNQIILCKHIIPIKEIDYFTFSENEDLIKISIFVNEKTLIKGKCSNDNYKNNYTKDYDFVLDKSFREADMINRMRKALNNIIKLNGGTIKKETF